MPKPWCRSAVAAVLSIAKLRPLGTPPTSLVHVATYEAFRTTIVALVSVVVPGLFVSNVYTRSVTTGGLRFNPHIGALPAYNAGMNIE